MNKVKSNHFRCFFNIEMTTNRIPHVGMEFFKAVCLCKYRFSKSLGRIAALWGFFNKKKNFVHGKLLLKNEYSRVSSDKQ